MRIVSEIFKEKDKQVNRRRKDLTNKNIWGYSSTALQNSTGWRQPVDHLPFGTSDYESRSQWSERDSNP